MVLSPAGEMPLICTHHHAKPENLKEKNVDNASIPSMLQVISMRNLTMANTYTQIHIHVITAVKFREALILPSWNKQLHQYITGIVQANGHKMLVINSMPDHLHMFFGFRPTQSLSSLMQVVKGDSSEWINKHRFSSKAFQWQAGYGAFSYAKSQMKTVADYVENQQRHHSQMKFLQEYIEFLNAFEIDYDARFIFKKLE
jgi:putative transposase